MPENNQFKPNADTWYDKVGTVTIILSFLVIPILKFGNEFIWIKTTVLIAVVMILTFLWLLRGIDRGEIVFPKTSLWIPMLIMIGITFAHLIHVTDIWRAVDMMIRLGANIFFWFFTLLYIRKRSHIRWIIIAMAVSVFIVAMYGIMQFYQILPCPYDIYGEKDPSSTIGLTNFSAEWMIGFMSLLIFAFFMEDFNLETKTALFFLFIPTYFYFVLTKARAAWVGFMLSGIVLLGFFMYQWIKLRKIRYLAAGGVKTKQEQHTVPIKFSKGRQFGVIVTFLLLVALGGTILSVTHFGKKKQLVSVYHTVEDVEEPHKTVIRSIYDILTSKILTHDPSINFRFMAWRSTYDAWKHNPIFGVGVGQIEVDIHKYQVLPLQEIISKTYQVFSESHNDWLQILAELGIIGFIAFLWIILNIAVKLIETAKKNIANEDKFLLSLAVGGGIMSVLIAAIFSFPLQEPASSMYFWGLIAMADIIYRGFDDNTPQEIQKRQKWIIPQEPPKYLLFYNPLKRDKFPMPLKQLIMTGAIILSIISVFILPIYAGRTADAENHIKDGVAYRNRRDFAAAIHEFDDAISLNPFEYIYYFHRAIVEFNSGEIKQTISDLDRSLKLSPYFGLAYRLRGGAYLAENNCAKAVPDFENAIKYLPPIVSEIGNQLVSCDVRLGKYGDVVKVAELQIKFGPKNPDAYYNIGNAMFLEGKYSEALTNYQKSVELDPTFQPGWLNIAMAYYYIKDFNNGDKYFEKAKKLNPDNPIVWYDHAVGLALQGENRAAIESLKKAIEKKPDLKFSALEEPSFAPLRAMPSFQKIIGKTDMNKFEQIEKIKKLFKK